ncbi:MAG: pyruvate oxidase [Actinomycetaceae bacterium]|nr:pyruvate oxidase [Actinomycetaceae bacterium]
MPTINAGDAMMKVLHSWGVKRIYGLPGGSLDSTMNAIHNWRDKIDYIGVRHEEAGALAAVAEAKLTGRIGVTLGSAGPGAVHLLNGLYDAKLDNIPVLALIGQVPSFNMNKDYFQELPENPIFADVAVYNRTVMTAEQLPMVIDKAISTAYEKRGVAVVVIPKDFAWKEVEDNYVSSAGVFTQPEWERPAREEDVKKAADMLINSTKPYIYFGQGVAGAADELREISQLLQVPMGSTYLAKPIFEGDEPAWMMSTGRLSTKPGVEFARFSEDVLFIGTNYEFPSFNPEGNFIDVNLRPSVIGDRHPAMLGVLADAPTFLRQLLAHLKERAAAGEDLTSKHQAWYDAALEDRREWDAWVAKQAERSSESPARMEPIYKVINEFADDDAVFGIDVGNVNIATARFLHLGKDKVFTTSPLYATMGYGVPAGLAAALEYPDREVWTLSGDGGFAMMSQDLVAQRDQNLGIINVVFTNKSLGFIEAEQDDTKQPHSGIDLSDIDFAKVAEGFGVKGYTVRTGDEFREVMKEVKGTKVPVVIDVKVTNDRLIPNEQFGFLEGEALENLRVEYGATDLTPLAELYERAS